MSRTLAREVAFKALFQLEFNHGEENERELYEDLAVETAIEETEDEESEKLNRRNVLYINQTVRGARARVTDIDETIKKFLKKSWSLSRLGTAERNILRLAVYELKFAENKNPAGVIINEAVELAKKYGADDSSRFINGILDAIASQ